MITKPRFLEAPRRLRAFVRAHETSLVVLALLIGTLGGLAVAAMSVAVEGLHVVLFNLEWGDRLSSQFRIEPWRALLVPSLGGLLLGVAFLLLLRWRPAREIDPIEANALHGGRMSFRGSVVVALETIWSSGVGASVGLEAGYTQLASGLAASLGRGFHLRRADQRLMVGCGAAAAIAGAFGAPLGGVAIMRGVAFWEELFSKTGIWPPLRPALGGLAVGLLALQTPQVMSSGHGALHFDGLVSMPLAAIATIFVLKSIASVISLGSGFRGGLFFATLFLGALGGRLFAAGFDVLWPGLHVDPNVYAIVGMSALSASVIGGPLTMSFIALESTGDLWLTTIVLVAVIISTQITRELFGYSFATWRLHLRGETIRSAADVGWIRDLTVRRLMRPDVATVNADMPIAEFRAKFPLGSKTQVVAVDETGHYVGLVLVAEVHAPDIDTAKGLRGILHHQRDVLHPAMNIQDAIAVFDVAEAESLAVVETGSERRPIGLLTEAHAMRRYAEESERRRREVIGDA